MVLVDRGRWWVWLCCDGRGGSAVTEMDDHSLR